MRIFRKGAPLFAILAATTVACIGGPEPPTPPIPQQCASDIRPPAGFEQRGVITVRESDHVGIRIVYTDPHDRMLASLAGIPGDYGEHSSFGGHVAVAGNGTGDVFGEDQRWALVWAGAEPCSPRAVIGNGFTKGEFVRTLTEIGVID